MDVIINYLTPNKTMELVQEIRQMGLKQGEDFDFSYYQTKWDEMIGEIPEHTKFTFYDDKWATIFSLKYGDRNR